MNTLSSFSQPHVLSILTIFFFSLNDRRGSLFYVSLLFIIVFYLQSSVGFIVVLDPFDFNCMKKKKIEASLKYI